jgi:hypothetical protein
MYRIPVAVLRRGDFFALLKRVSSDVMQRFVDNQVSSLLLYEYI